MAGRSRSVAAAHRLFAPPGPGPARPAVAPDQGGADEFEESDIWGSPPSASDHCSARPAMATPKAKPRKPAAAAAGGGGAASLPVNIPDWSKILGAEYGRSAGADGRPAYGGGDSFGGGRGGGEPEQWVPPHELLLCRNRAAASFSVHEGAGRTLKGRDLRRVRNAIWEKTGFQD